MGLLGHVARMGSGKVRTVLWWVNLREIDNLEDLGVDGRRTLKLIFKKWDGGMDWFDLAQVQVVGFSERGNGHSCAIKCGEYLD